MFGSALRITQDKTLKNGRLSSFSFYVLTQPQKYFKSIEKYEHTINEKVNSEKNGTNTSRNTTVGSIKDVIIVTLNCALRL